MSKIYLADKKSLRTKPKGSSKSEKKTKSVREKSDKESWGDTMGGLFKVIAFIGQKRIYKMFNVLPHSLLNGLGHLIGKIIMGSSRKVQKRTRASLRALYPNFTKKRIEKLVDCHVKYMGQFLLDVIFRLPTTCDFPPNAHVKYFKYLNFEVLDKKLEKGKGVIIPILHLGEHFHNPAIFLHPKKYNMSTVVSVKNLPMYEFNNRAHFTNLFMYASTGFSQIKDRLHKDLDAGHILVMYHDYSSTSQLRVPVIHGTYPYLIHTPQSYISLHKRTGAEILPLITVPDGSFGYSKLFFLDNSSIMDISKKYWDTDSKEFHGRLSTEINRMMYPYIRQYGPYWEEIMRFAGLRCADKLKIPPNTTVNAGIELIEEKIESILENSWEPDRNDEHILNVIKPILKEIKQELKKPSAIIRPHKTFINLSLMNAKDEILKLIQVMKKILTEKQENKAYKLMNSLETAVTSS